MTVEPDGADLTFEQLVDELEATIARMAGGSLGIEEVTTLYERAGRLHRLASARLEAISARIDKLTAPGFDDPDDPGSTATSS